MTSSTRIDPAVPVRGQRTPHGRRATSKDVLGGENRDGAEQLVGGWSAPLPFAGGGAQPVLLVRAPGPDAGQLLRTLRVLRVQRGR